MGIWEYIHYSIEYILARLPFIHIVHTEVQHSQHARLENTEITDHQNNDRDWIIKDSS